MKDFVMVSPQELSRIQTERAMECLKDWKQLDLESYEDAEDRVHILERLALVDRKRRGLLHLIGKTEVPQCAVCESRMARGLEFYDWDGRGYPWQRWRLAVRPVCESEDCGDGGYFIPWPALRPIEREADEGELQGPDGWLYHLSQKTWFDYSFIAELEIGGQIAIAYGHELMRLARLGHPPPPQRKVGASARSIPTRTRTYVFERDNFRCRRCGASSATGARLVIDHIIAVAKGGCGDPENLQVLCTDCNAGKSDRDPHPHDLRR